jgi:hypothetical protein
MKTSTQKILTSSLVVALALPTLASPVNAAPDRDARQERREERREERKDDRQERREERKDDRSGGTVDPGVNARQRAEKRRIRRGVASGSLTPAEAKRMKDRQAALKGLEAAYKADGALTVDERKALHRELDALSQDIFEQKHDKQDRDVIPRLADGATRAEAREAVKTATRISVIRTELNRTDLPAGERDKLLAEHDQLVDKLYDER